MKIAEILKDKGGRVVTVRSNVSLASAARRMIAERIGAVVVSDDDVHMVGILSERDVLRATALHAGAAADLQVADMMTRALIACAPGDSVTQVLGVMTDRRVRHVPVVEDGRLAGIVTIGDLVKARLEEAALESRVMRDVNMANR